MAFDQTAFAPLSGNVALDLAVCVFGGMYFVRLARNCFEHAKSVHYQRERTLTARLRLRDGASVVSSLHEELLGAREQVQTSVGAYLEDVDNRGRISAVAQERERDPTFSELEAQLAKAASKLQSPTRR
jgi:hypothetical protein